MSWLNTPVSICEDEHTYTETQSYFWGGIATAKYTRDRKVTVTRERWVGGNYAAAVAKKNELITDTQYSDVHVQPAGGGQYHCIAIKTVNEDWSAWVFEELPDE